MKFKFFLFSTVIMFNLSFAQAIDFNNDLNNDLKNSTLARVVIIINEGDRTEKNREGQTVALYKEGVFQGRFDVSTASNGIKNPTVGKPYIASTPHGFYRPKRVYEDYSSYTFYGANMKYAIFFNGGIALHASEHIEGLGHRASGGCIRVKEEVAEWLNAAILSTGEPHRDTTSEDFCNSKGENCYKRSLYTNRIKLPNIDPKTGQELNSNVIWTYPTLIVVKPGL